MDQRTKLIGGSIGVLILFLLGNYVASVMFSLLTYVFVPLDIKPLREDFNFSLSQAKENTDNLLEGEIIQLSFNENEKNELINKLTKLKVNYSFD